MVRTNAEIATADVAILGSGSIGVAFAIVFARAGHRVRIFDPDTAQRASAPERLRQRLRDLASFGLLEEAPALIAARLQVAGTLAEAVAGAVFCQECGPERLEVKQAIFAELDRLARPDAVLASASSAIVASRFAADLPGRGRVLIAHPGNPPFLIPVIELVPAPFTAPETMDRADAFLTGAGMSPIRLRREIEGFVFNRLQGAVLREAYCLLRDGIVSADDIDRVMRDGLAPRWSLIGPFETADLNTVGGIASHAEKMGPAYARMGAERGQRDPWTPEMVQAVTRARRSALPLEHWDDRVAWRDRQLMALMRHRREAEAEAEGGANS